MSIPQKCSNINERESMNLSQRHVSHSCLLRICYKSSTSPKHHQISSTFANVHRPNQSSLEIRQKSNNLSLLFPGSSQIPQYSRLTCGWPKQSNHPGSVNDPLHRIRLSIQCLVNGSVDDSGPVSFWFEIHVLHIR